MGCGSRKKRVEEILGGSYVFLLGSFYWKLKGVVRKKMRASFKNQLTHASHVPQPQPQIYVCDLCFFYFETM